MIKIKNSKLQSIANFLKDAKLAGKVSRYRSKLLADIEAKMMELAKDEQNIVKESGATINDKGNITDFPDDDSRLLLQKELTDIRFEQSIFNEKIVGQFSALYIAMCEYSEPLAGQDAQAYDDLMEVLEEGGYDEQSD
ncbi:hypothetical protein [Fructobacillus fructosus]|uniref:hypothetical protein n=1 Tax=Fructobacillus fructosus TaxID=1631 RepID=UPI002D9CCC78|nr:hypothetical protein LMG30235_GOPAMIKF_00023 [Fructobacillus fructosus]CAK1222785.1 hypothetical protein LMG30234_GAICNKDF_00023 [Fructobacillus fructosus]CAK1222912.1 hypothetical protein R54866_LGPIEIPA_00023 [Fructobacillus fructosus]